MITKYNVGDILNFPVRITAIFIDNGDGLQYKLESMVKESDNNSRWEIWYKDKALQGQGVSIRE